MADRITIERDTQEIANLFKVASTAIQLLILKYAIDTEKDINKVLALGVTNELRKLEKKVYPLITKSIHNHYTTAGLIGSNAMKRSGLDVSGALTDADRLKITELVTSTLSDYGETMRGAFNSARTVMTEARKKRIDLMLEAVTTDRGSLKEVQKKIAEDIAKDFFAIRDKSGKRWKPEVYAEMLTRTRLREVTNTGLTDRMLREGYDLVEVSTHHSDHDECAYWEGKILSLTGNTLGYPTVSDAEFQGLFHPNCKHRLLPYHSQFSRSL